ncbi:MAG TPA: MraY family glycosyltransferase [Solirubrobacteraceae bacterium]|nr:MraY family glycosyltransferase [Solirubrobacteraceae bacterium]
MNPSGLDALYAFAAATVIAALLTPLTMRLARRVGAVDRPSDRGLSARATPLLGGLAIFAAVLVAGLIWLPDMTRAVHRDHHLVSSAVHWQGVLLAAAVITLIGAIDDRFDLHPLAKLLGQVAAAIIAERYGVVVREMTLPLIGALHFPNAGPTLTVVWLVAMMNVVNFSDGVDGLAAGVCAIIAAAFAVIAFNLGQNAAGVLAALTAGAALGFLLHNFHPASSFMGDCGANLLGLLMGTIAVTGDLKTTASVAFALPLILLMVPFLDTTFVVLKRLKYKKPVYVADAEHFHHRMARIGFSVRRTVIYLYIWTLMLAGLALALRFVPYSNHHGRFDLGWTLALIAYGVVVALASVYLVYVLEIVKFRGRSASLASRRGARARAVSRHAGASATPADGEQPQRRAGGGGARR